MRNHVHRAHRAPPICSASPGRDTAERRRKRTSRGSATRRFAQRILISEEAFGSSRGVRPLIIEVGLPLTVTAPLRLRRCHSNSGGQAMTLIDDARVRITPAQLRVLGLLAQGSTYEAIARALFVSQTTVRTHVGALQRRLRVTNNVSLVLAGVVVGLLSAETWPITLTGAVEFDPRVLEQSQATMAIQEGPTGRRLD